MHAFISHPVFQAVFAPFVVALFTAELLQRLRLSGLSIIAGLAITVYLIHGFYFEPLTATRKIILLGLGCGVVAIPLIILNWSVWRIVLTVFTGSAAIWVALPSLMSHALPVAMQWGIGIALFAGWVTYWMDTLEDTPVRAASAGWGIGLGTGLALMLAGYPVLGKLNLAIGFAAFAYLMIMFVSNSLLAAGRTFTLPLGVVSSLSISFVIVSGKLPWYLALPVALTPIAARLPVSDKSAVWIQATLVTFATLICAAITAFISVNRHGWGSFL